jgi:16S rRNA (guanine527-N7)-methyltransferase
MERTNPNRIVTPIAPWGEVHSKALIDGAGALGLALTTIHIAQFAQYYTELAIWNQRINLTAITDASQVVERHFLDSLSCFFAFPKVTAGLNLIDVGTGAGFPGMPLKIVRPELELALLEAVGKKAGFLRHIVSILGLSKAQIVVARAEEAGRQATHREAYDLAVCRAVAEMAVLAEYCLPLIKIGGRFIAPKKTGIDQEIEAAGYAIEVLGGHLEPPVYLADGERQLVVVEKIKQTPTTYPRRPGMPAKRPLRGGAGKARKTEEN